ncbi:hypothetical protein E5E91_10450 [Deinococcus radiodurans R1 = ATCC 13939 = DSM 20539]|nr:hypothetical protein DXG80_06365 [Deinococcus radiodurans]UDL01744.1 hypothetical protein E5E91_10450 [Deinococcus radiodurans R1 = ATCC 13939 = DSM 20539]
MSLEQSSELRVRRNSTATRSILRPAQCFVLAPLAKMLCHLFGKCSIDNGVGMNW